MHVILTVILLEPYVIGILVVKIPEFSYSLNNRDFLTFSCKCEIFLARCKFCRLGKTVIIAATCD